MDAQEPYKTFLDFMPAGAYDGTIEQFKTDKREVTCQIVVKPEPTNTNGLVVEITVNTYPHQVLDGYDASMKLDSDYKSVEI